MSSNAPVPLRHCPLCGVAMQASKTSDHAPQFDRFDCLTCGTTIELPYRAASGGTDEQD